MQTVNLFNSIWYLQQNPDIAAAVQAGLIDAETHFKLFGLPEGRSPSPLFNPQDYLSNNPDIAEAVQNGLLTAYDHFMNYGLNEGRSPNSLFNEALYLQQNPDVAQAVLAGIINPVQHLLLFGASEDRVVNPAINLGLYMNANTDVQNAVSNGVMSALEHLIMYGVREGRDLGNGVSLGQFQNDPVFLQALAGGNVLQALTRVVDVAPFIPTFQRPEGWTPAANTPIPTNFVPTAEFKLVVPPEVTVPPGTDLRDTVFLIEQPNGGSAPFSDNHTVSFDDDTNAFIIDFNQAVANNTADLDALEAAITFSTDGTTFTALANGDTVTIVDGNLVVTFNSVPVSNTVQFKVAVDALKNTSGSSNRAEITTSSLDNKPPAIASLEYDDNSATVTLTYTEALSGNLEGGDFVVTLQDDTTVVVDAAVIGDSPNNNQITLTLASPIAADSIKSIAYDAAHGIAGSILDTNGNAAKNQTFNTAAGIGGNPDTTSLTYSANGSTEFEDDPANEIIGVGDRFTVPTVAPFTPSTQISAPDTFNSWGDDQVHNSQFEVFYGTYDTDTTIFTVTSTPYSSGFLDATHTFILYDNDSSASADILDGLVVEGVYAETQWYVGGEVGSRYLAYDGLLTSETLASSADYYLDYYANALYGTSGEDTIDGKAYDDIIVGGGGADNLTGGAGIDTFVFARADSVLASMDTITDYRAADGSNAGALDVIRLTDIEAVVSTSGVVTSPMIGSIEEALDWAASFNNVNEGLSVFIWNNDTYFYVEQNGGGTEYVETDWVVKVTGTPFASSTSINTLGVEDLGMPPA